MTHTMQMCNSCSENVEIKFFCEIFISTRLFFIRTQDVLSHCKIVQFRINRLTQFMLNALKASMAAYRKCFYLKWLKFPRLNWSEIWHFTWVQKLFLEFFKNYSKISSTATASFIFCGQSRVIEFISADFVCCECKRPLRACDNRWYKF